MDMNCHRRSPQPSNERCDTRIARLIERVRVSGKLCCITAAFAAAALLAFAATVVAAQTAGPGAKANASAGNVQTGRQLFASQNCAICHGTEGQVAVGPRIAPPGRALYDFMQYVRQPTGKMPAVTRETLPDARLTDIYAFLQSIAPAAGPAVSAASGNAENGKRIYTSYGCYQCHGREGQGSMQTGAPPIGPPAISISAFASYIHQPTGQMPPYTSKVVSDSDIADIYVFLQSIPPPPSAKSIPLLNR
jgi:mono/diheme cytochrome c family protein